VGLPKTRKSTSLTDSKRRKFAGRIRCFHIGILLSSGISNGGFTMRSRIDEQPALFHSFCVEDRIRADHPLRDVKRRTDRILASLSGEFAKCYSRTGRPSVRRNACFDKLPPIAIKSRLLTLSLLSINQS